MADAGADCVTSECGRTDSRASWFGLNNVELELID